MKKIVLFIALCLVAMLAVWLLFSPVGENQAVEESSFSSPLTADSEGFAKALEPRPFLFPEDHGAHDGYRSEWWYFTGNLEDPNGRRFGYQLTFFRFALAPDNIESESAWRDRQLYMAHFTVTDVEGRRFHSAERFSRTALDLAGARNDRFQVWLHDWSAEGINSGIFPMRLKAEHDDFAIDLLLSTQKPVVLQGDRGFSRKSDKPGNASYYYSYTRLSTEGSVSIDGQHFPVTGSSWMDREWSTSALSEDQAGWDWFSLQLSNDTELMVYQLRLKDGSIDPHSSGTLIPDRSDPVALQVDDVMIEVLDEWTSPHSKRTYPSRWRLTIPKQQLQLEVEPLINDQELNLAFRYWEGAARVSGTHRGLPVTGFGYVELTGY